MKLFTDLEIHSKYSRAVSRDMTLENIEEWSRIKGINVVGTGDFTHPAWFKDIKEKLESAEPGLYHLKKSWRKSDRGQTPWFLLSGEISCIYSKGGKVRKVHHLVFVPDISTAEKVINKLSLIGNIASDGRPILGLDSKRLLSLLLDASPDAVLIPAHVWTPWFGVFGSKSGFDSLEECFEELTLHIPGVETGLSSDPAMNWRLSWLDSKAIVSFSDPHSLHRLGREATVFEVEPSYFEIMKAIKAKDPKRLLFTVEYFPEGGKYHFDGHRLCRAPMSPQETKERKGICRVCGRSVTIGVMNRVEELADRPSGFQLDGAIPFKSLFPLDEVIAVSIGLVSSSSKKVKAEYDQLINAMGTEYSVLLDAPREELLKVTSSAVTEGIIAVREGRIAVDPGYDGEYGKLSIAMTLSRQPVNQESLF